MVYAFTEAQKQEIESLGLKVIELKRVMRKMSEWAERVNQCFKEWVDRVTRELSEICVGWNKLCDMIDDLALAFEEFKFDCQYSTSTRYKVTYFLSKCTGIEKKCIWRQLRPAYYARSNC
ncbi:MAG: hypothetical protein J1E64_14985 [Acetatifactor sp.]|nr:hypothetical protein [Acetatifactor sp.]